MRRLFNMLVVFFSIYLLIQLGFKYFGNGHEIEYQIETAGKKFNVKEIFVTNTQNEKDSYYFDVSVDDVLFSFQTYENFNKKEMIIKDFKYFENEHYKCLLPIFYQEKIVMDIMCLNNSIIYYYHNIKGNDSELDSFVNNIDAYNYDLDLWKNDVEKSEKTGPVTIYVNNVIKEHYFGINSYKGIYLYNHTYNNIREIELFSNDIYTRDLEVMVDNCYVVADYNSKYEFSNFIVVNLMNGNKSIIKSNKKISFDSYIQGVVDRSIYIYDRSNKKQYELDINSNNVLEVGNPDTGIKYYNNGKWEYLEINELSKEDVIFNYGQTSTDNLEYERIDTTNYSKTGYTFYYKKTNNGYNVYRAPNRNPEIKTHLFTVKNISNIKYFDDFIYFVDGNTVKYYNDKMGLKSLFKNDEFDFNSSLKYSIYIEK